MVSQFCRILEGNWNLEDALASVARWMMCSLPIESVAVGLYRPSLKSVYFPVSVASSEDSSIVTADMSLKLADGSLMVQCLDSTGQYVILEEPSFDPVLGHVPAPGLAMPIRYRGAVLGLFLIKWRDISPAIDQRTISSVSDVARLTGLMIAADLTEKKLAEADERYRMLTENASDIVFVLDRGGRFLYVNSRIADVLGYEPQEVCGKYFGEFVSPDSWAETVAALRKAQSRGERFLEYSWVAQKKDGQWVLLDVRASLLYHGPDLIRHQGIARDAAREKHLHEELARRERELDTSRSRMADMKAYLSVATRAQEEERARIARDLHDSVLQQMIGLKRKIELMGKMLTSADKLPEVHRILDETRSSLDETAAYLREFARNLRPPILDDFGLTYACEWLADQVEKEGVQVSLSVTGKEIRLPQETEISVFRIVQEALSNAIKHSGADMIGISIDFRRDSVVIAISDNGQGFEFKQPSASLARAGQMGLIGMFERAELISASIEVDSRPGSGTTVTIRVPVDRAQ